MAFINNKLLKITSENKFALVKLYSKQPQTTSNKITSKSLINPLPALGIAIPIDILSYTYTNLHYGKNIITPEIALLIGGLGVFTYNYDRILDVVNNINTYKNPLNKKKTAKYYLNNLNYLYPSLIVLYGYLTNYFNNDELLIPFLYIINSTLGYKLLKTNFGEFKAIYIATCWCAACEILPCIIHDNNYDILNYPLDYLPLFLTLFGYSNLADIKDVDEDKIDGINTLPVKYGDNISRKLSFISILFAIVLFGINPHYHDNLLWNNLFQLGNIGYIGGEILVENILENNKTYIDKAFTNNSNIDAGILAVSARMLGI